MACVPRSDLITVALRPNKSSELLDPRKIQFTSEFFLLENLTARLVRFDENGDYQLDFASDVKKISETEFDVKIKKSGFSNGEPITLDDVKNSIERTAQRGSNHVNLKEILKEVSVEGDKLKIRLHKSSKFFWYFLSLPDMGILHKSQVMKDKIYVEDFFRVSSGPFRYEKNGDSYYLVRNRNYLLSGVAYVDKIKLVAPFEIDSAREIIDGRVSLGKLSLDSFIRNRKEIGQKKNLKLMGVPSDSFTYIFFNKYSDKFKKKSHREWFRRKIHDSFILPDGFADIAKKSYQYFPLGSKAFVDEEEIKKLWEKAPIEKPKDFPDRIILRTYTTIFHVSFEPLIRQLEKIADVEIKVVSDVAPDDYVSKMKNGEFDVFVNNMSTDIRIPAEAINFEYFSSDSPLSDVTGKIKSEYDSYQQANGEFEEKDHLKNISKQMIEDAQFIPLFHSISPHVVNVDQIDIGDSNHLFIYNFWKFKAK